MIRGLVLWLVLALPVAATELPDPNEILDRAVSLSAEDDFDGAYEVLAQGLQAARNAGDLSPDWGIVFAVMADTVRNVRENPAYALMLAEEGLAVVAPNAADAQDVIAILNTSRSYALADMGRMEEAAAVGRMAEPLLRAGMGDQVADDYLREIASWEAGATTKESGVSPMALAERSRKDAAAALDDGDYARALTLAAQAMLPVNSGLPQGEVFLSNADAMRMTGRALYGMGRKEEALDALLQAASLAFEPGWDELEVPVFFVKVEGAEEQLTDLMIWLARTLMDVGGDDQDYLLLAGRMADMAGRMTPTGPSSFTTAYLRSSLATRLGKPERAVAELTAMAAKARAEGMEDYALLSEFYVQTLTDANVGAVEEMDTDALIAAATAAIDHARANPASIIDPGFVAGETAGFLILTGRTDAALKFARQAFQARVDWLAASGSAGLGEDAYRRNTRSLAETLLQAASRKDGTQPGAVCSDVEGVGCVIIVETPANSPG
jgi:tetratricopeptide (TPR) repeat protein